MHEGSRLRVPSGHALRAARAWIGPEEDSFVRDWLFIPDGRGRIAASGPWKTLSRQWSGPVHEAGPRAVAPGLINAHTHLGLSHLRGRTRLGHGFETWVRSLLPLLVEKPAPHALRAALRELGASGTVHVGDVATTHHDLVRECVRASSCSATFFVEFLGFPKKSLSSLPWPPNVLRPERCPSVAAAGHALYSTHPDLLKAAKAWDTARSRPFSLHLAEHPGEVEFLATGQGAFADLVRERLVPPSFAPPRCSPVEYADRLGLLDARTLAVHGVHLSGQDITRLKERGATLCLCPRSNELIGAGRAPWESLLRASVPLCFGTDSLASNTDLDLWSEILFFAARRPLPLGRLLTMAAPIPAAVLGLSRRLGALRPGRAYRFSLVPKELEEFSENR